MNKLTTFSWGYLLILFGILCITTLTAQPLNNHLIFDGVDDYISLNNLDVTGNAITLEALVNSTNLDNCTNGECRIISKATSINGADHHWMLSTINSSTNTVLRFRLKTGGVTITQIATVGFISENTWYHVAGVYDGATMKLFLNGTEVSSIPKTGSLTSNTSAEAWIGGNPPLANSRPWQGGIDEVRIWDIARTQTALQVNQSVELTGNEPGLLAYYQFNEGVGQTIYDQTGNNTTILGSSNAPDTNDPNFANTNPNHSVTFNLKVFLEGPYDAGQTGMTGDLLTRGLVPQGQPYFDYPWNYQGTEGTGWLPSDYPVETVDWVLVTLRQSLDPSSEVARVAAVLLRDGTISPFNITLNNSPAHLYVMVEHRNHLPILSKQLVPIVNNTFSYDFTQENSFNPSGFGQKKIGTNWMMYGGNADQVGPLSCDINASDRIYWQSVNGQFDTYNPGDFNLDGDISAADRIIYFYNNGIFSTVPKEVACQDDNRYVTSTVLDLTSSSIKLQVELAQDLPLRLCYYPATDSTQLQYGICEARAQFGTLGNEHIQTISGLADSTEYFVVIQTSQDVGNNSSDCPTMTWENISCPIAFTTLSGSTPPTEPPAGNWGVAQSDPDYDENLPYSGIFVGAANPGFFGAANTANGRHQTIRFRAEKTGAINAVTIQNRIFTGSTIHTRANNGSAAAPRYQSCLDEWASRGNPILNSNNVTENKKANKCAYHIGNFYSAGNGGAIIFQIRHDLNGAPDMVNPPLAETAVPFIPVEHPNATFPTHVLSSPANVTAGVFYHVTMFNTTPVAGSHVLLPVDQAYNMPDNTGALSLNGINYAASPNVAGQEGPFYAGHYTMRSSAMNASTWVRDPNTYGWYGVRYSSGDWSGLMAAAWDVFGTGKQFIEGNRHARQVLTATHNTTVDGIWVQHGHTANANGQPMTIALKLGSNTLATASIQHDADVKAAVASATSPWQVAASAWTYATFDNDVSLIQGNTYYIEASAVAGAGFRLNNMGNSYGGAFNQNMQNIPLNTHIQRSENGGATWTNFPNSGSYPTNRNLQMLMTVKGMPRSLTE